MVIVQSPSRSAQMSTTKGIGQEVQPERIHQVGGFETIFAAVGCCCQVECYGVTGRVRCARVGACTVAEISTAAIASRLDDGWTLPK
jgi:hypothetical protein